MSTSASAASLVALLSVLPLPFPLCGLVDWRPAGAALRGRSTDPDLPLHGDLRCGREAALPLIVGSSFPQFWHSPCVPGLLWIFDDQLQCLHCKYTIFGAMAIWRVELVGGVDGGLLP